MIRSSSLRLQRIPASELAMPGALFQLKHDYGAAALDKALDILEYLSVANSFVPLSAIAGELSRKQIEIIRIMRVLERRGYISHNISLGYCLTTKPFALGVLRGASVDIVKAANEHLKTHADEMAQTCSLGVIIANSAVVIASAVPTCPFAVKVCIGSQAGLTTSTIGTVLYAYLPEHEREALGRYLRGRTTEADWRAFRKAVDLAYHAGYAEGSDSQLPVVTHIAVPVRVGQRLLGALNMPFIQRRQGPDKTHLRKMLIEVAESFAERL